MDIQKLTNEERQALIERCQKHIAWLLTLTPEAFSVCNSVKEQIDIYGIALAALTAEPVPDGWEACSPEWIERNGPCSCANAPRLAFGSVGQHYHPHTFIDNTAQQYEALAPRVLVGVVEEDEKGFRCRFTGKVEDGDLLFRAPRKKLED